MRIFTHSIISPGLSLRQCPSRCTFRAGRNLPDKEFRYLRTVIVTAAVYWGFGSMLRDKSLTHPLNLPAPGRCQPLYFAFLASQRLMFLLNSRLGLFTAASRYEKHPFSRSYGVILPSSLTRVLPLTFGFSPCSPVSGSCTRTCILTRGFSWHCDRATSVLYFPPHHILRWLDGFAYPTLLLLGRTHPSVRFPYPPASPLRSKNYEVVQEYQPVVHRLRPSASA